MKATLKLVGVELPRALFKREPYVTAVAVAEGTDAKSAAGVMVVAPTDPAEAHPDAPTPELPQPPDPKTPASTEVSSEVFRGVDHKHPLQCDVVLYDGEVGKFLVVHGAVMESDGGYRRAGSRLDNARHAIDQTGLGQALVAAGVAASGPTVALAAEAGQVIANLLRTNGDDIMVEFAISLHGVREFRAARDNGIVVENRDCRATFTLELSEESADSDEAEGDAKPKATPKPTAKATPKAKAKAAPPKPAPKAKAKVEKPAPKAATPKPTASPDTSSSSDAAAPAEETAKSDATSGN